MIYTIVKSVCIHNAVLVCPVPVRPLIKIDPKLNIPRIGKESKELFYSLIPIDSQHCQKGIEEKFWKGKNRKGNG